MIDAIGLGHVLLVAAAACGAAWYFTLTEWHVTFWGFPLDDAWIHLQFAKNIGHGLGFSYNPGIQVAGSTAPLWTLVLAIPAVLRLDPIVSAKVIGLLLTIVAALLAGEVARWLSGSRVAGLYTALVLALSPRMTWGSLSGMEVGLYTALESGLLAYLRALEERTPVVGPARGAGRHGASGDVHRFSDPGARLDDSIAARTTAGAAPSHVHPADGALRDSWPPPSWP